MSGTRWSRAATARSPDSAITSSAWRWLRAIDASWAAWRESGSTTSISDMMVLRPKHAYEEDGAGDHQHGQRALLDDDLARGERRRLDLRGAFHDATFDRARADAADALAHTIVGERDQRNQHREGGRRHQRVTKSHRKPLSQLPFRCARAIQRRIFRSVFTRARGECDRRSH